MHEKFLLLVGVIEDNNLGPLLLKFLVATNDVRHKWILIYGCLRRLPDVLIFRETCQCNPATAIGDGTELL